MKLIRIYTEISAMPFRFAEQLASIIFKKVRRHFLEVCKNSSDLFTFTV